MLFHVSPFWPMNQYCLNILSYIRNMRAFDVIAKERRSAENLCLPKLKGGNHTFLRCKVTRLLNASNQSPSQHLASAYAILDSAYQTQTQLNLRPQLQPTKHSSFKKYSSAQPTSTQ